MSTLSVAVAYFYGSMSLLEGKVHEAIPRIQAVCLQWIQSPDLSHFPFLRHTLQRSFATGLSRSCGLLTY